MEIRLSEHKSITIKRTESIELERDANNALSVHTPIFEQYSSLSTKAFNNNTPCYTVVQQEDSCIIAAHYCIGIDWLGSTGKYIHVEPKINTLNIKAFEAQLVDYSVDEHYKKEAGNTAYELDYLKMLLQVTSIAESTKETQNLIQIDWDAPPIAIQQKDDKLTPFLIIRFLQTLQTIVRKGLKKNYYKVQENLNNRVKGKILVGQHIKQNVYKNRLTSTYCEYQVFGEDHLENRFLKKVLQFVISYVENNKILLAKNYQVIQQTINYCRPAFELISGQIKETELKHIKHNPFYKDYKDAIEFGSHILKRFAYNISQTAEEQRHTPPFWIDTPQLFELYVYSKLLEANPDHKKEIHFQFSTYGNALDILISTPSHQMVIDAKYKLHYQQGYLHQDIRQVAGYARLNKVREKLKLTKDNDKHINCLIIYPDIENGIETLPLNKLIHNKNEINGYYKVYKLGVKLPVIEQTH